MSGFLRPGLIQPSASGTLEAPGPFRRRRVMVVRAGDRFFQRHGGKSVFLARWVALVRVAAAMAKHAEFLRHGQPLAGRA